MPEQGRGEREPNSVSPLPSVTRGHSRGLVSAQRRECFRESSTAYRFAGLGTLSSSHWFLWPHSRPWPPTGGCHFHSQEASCGVFFQFNSKRPSHLSDPHIVDVFLLPLNLLVVCLPPSHSHYRCLCCQLSVQTPSFLPPRSLMNPSETSLYNLTLADTHSKSSQLQFYPLFGPK